MKKVALPLSITLILLLLFNLTVFILPLPRTTTFWIAYGFTLFALLIESVVTCWQVVDKADTRFLKVPAFAITSLYTVIQLFTGMLLMIFAKSVSTRYAVLTCSLLLGFALILVLPTLFSRRELDEMAQKGRVNRTTTRALSVKITSLANTADEGIKNELIDLATALKYSAPSSDPAVLACDEKLSTQYTNLKPLVASGEFNTVNQILTEMRNILQEREGLCNSSK